MKVTLNAPQPWKVSTPKKKVVPNLDPNAPANYQKAMQSAFSATKAFGAMSPEAVAKRKRSTLKNAAGKVFGGLGS